MLRVQINGLNAPTEKPDLQENCRRTEKEKIGVQINTQQPLIEFPGMEDNRNKFGRYSSLSCARTVSMSFVLGLCTVAENDDVKILLMVKDSVD